MRTLLIAFAIAGTAAAPAVGQSNVAGDQAPAKARFVEKVVCQKVEEERSTGSRLGSTTRICRTVKIPVEEAQKKAASEAHAH